MNMEIKIKCKYCGTKLNNHQYSYCSNNCQQKNQYEKFVSDWKIGRKNGGVGVSTGSMSRHLRRYLFEKYDNSCSLCRWNKKHSRTGLPPLEIDHIDGDSKNNNEDNLRLLCPNCHALTDNYKSFNRGHGRTWRKSKYLKNS